MDVVLWIVLAAVGFSTGRWIGIRYEPGLAHYLIAAALIAIAGCVALGWQAALPAPVTAVIAGAYVGLSLGSYLRMLWKEERREHTS